MITAVSSPRGAWDKALRDVLNRIHPLIDHRRSPGVRHTSTNRGRRPETRSRNGDGERVPQAERRPDWTTTGGDLGPEQDLRA